MRSIRTTFEKVTAKNPFRGDYVNLAGAVRERGFSRETISKAFNKLVNRDEYDKADKKLLISHLVSLSKTPVDTLKQATLCL